MNLADKRIGQIIKTVRNERKMTQETLAKRLGLVHQSSLSRIEQGKQSLTAIEGFNVCQILGIPHRQLFMNMKVKK